MNPPTRAALSAPPASIRAAPSANPVPPETVPRVPTLLVDQDDPEGTFDDHLVGYLIPLLAADQARPAFRASRSHSLMVDALAFSFYLDKCSFSNSVYAHAPQRLYVLPKRPRAKALLLTRSHAH